MLIGGGRFRFEVPTAPPSRRRRQDPKRTRPASGSRFRARRVLRGCIRHSLTFPLGGRRGALRFASKNIGLAATRACARSSSMIRWSIRGTPGFIATRSTAGSLPTPSHATGSGRGSRKSGSGAAGFFNAASSGSSSRSCRRRPARDAAIWGGRDQRGPVNRCCNCRCSSSCAAALRIISPNMVFIWDESWFCSLSWSSLL